MRVLAIDQGTTSTRGLVLDETGKTEIVCTRTHKQVYPAPGHIEHDPEELLGNIIACLEAAGDIDAIGIDNQGESCLAWDAKSGEAISPVIVWQDRRTEKTTGQLKAGGAQELTMERAGLPLDPYFSASKLAWILQNIPTARALLARGQLRLGTTDAFFMDRLTGIYATDITTASRTSLLNLASGQWDPELCALFGVPIEVLPEIRPTLGDFGALRLNGRNIPLRASAVDQQASLYGHGCRRAGDIKFTFGTGAFALALTGETLIREPAKGILPTVAWQTRGEKPLYALDGGVYSAGAAINWARSLGLFSRFDEINTFKTPPAISRDLVFVPALSGLACPYWDGSAAGLWLGMSLETTTHDLVQAVLEGIAFRAAQVIEAMSASIPIGKIVSIDGGLSANPCFCQFLSTLLQRQVNVQAKGEITALGMALMAINKAEPVMPQGATPKMYHPATLPGNYKARFDEAVERSRNWRI